MAKIIKSLGIVVGEDGAVPNIQVGTVTTLPSGDEATVDITGTVENPVINFGIPEGPKGDGADIAIATAVKAGTLYTHYDSINNVLRLGTVPITGV